MAHAFVGGSPAYVMYIQRGVIENEASLAPSVDIPEPGLAALQRLRAIPGFEDESFRNVFWTFFASTGIPDPSTLPHLQEFFNIEDQDAQSPAFRPRLFYRTSTGREIIAERSRVRVSWPPSSAAAYSIPNKLSQVLFTGCVDASTDLAPTPASETIRWQTCMGTVHIPLIPFIRHLQQGGLPALHQWLFTELLSASQGGVGGTA